MNNRNSKSPNSSQSNQASDEVKNSSVDKKYEKDNQFLNKDFSTLNPSTPYSQRKSSIFFAPSPELGKAKALEERASIALSIPMEELVKRHSLQPIHLQNRVITRDIAAKEEGILPISLVATQLSTIRNGNTCAYRSGGPIPTNLYMKYLDGDAEPKQFISKGKSSNWGPQEGLIVLNNGLTRIIKTEKGHVLKKHNLQDFPRNQDNSVALETEPLKMTLRSIFEDAFIKKPQKYKILMENGNFVKNNILQFQQVNHDDPYVQNTLFSINITDEQKDNIESAKSSLLVSRNIGASFNKPFWESKNFPLNSLLDLAFSVTAKTPTDEKPEPIIKIARTVRDTDIDFFTKPTQLKKVFGKSDADMEKYNQPIDMKHGFNSDENMEDAINCAKMELQIFELNQMEWKQYDALVAQKKMELGPKYHNNLLVNKEPFIDRFHSPEDIGKFCILVGEATALEMYQSLEINAITQKMVTLNRLLKAKGHELNLDNFKDLQYKTEILAKLKNTLLQYDEKTLKRFFIQHPTETRNKTEYTCDRGGDVMILQGKIIIAQNDHEITKVLKSNANDEVININPYWLNSYKPSISAYATDWIDHFLSHTHHYENNFETQEAVAKYLITHSEYIQSYLNDPHADPVGIQFLKSFIEKNPDLKENTGLEIKNSESHFNNRPS